MRSKYVILVSPITRRKFFVDALPVSQLTKSRRHCFVSYDSVYIDEYLPDSKIWSHRIHWFVHRWIGHGGIWWYVGRCDRIGSVCGLCCTFCIWNTLLDLNKIDCLRVALPWVDVVWVRYLVVRRAKWGKGTENTRLKHGRRVEVEGMEKLFVCSARFELKERWIWLLVSERRPFHLAILGHYQSPEVVGKDGEDKVREKPERDYGKFSYSLYVV